MEPQKLLNEGVFMSNNISDFTTAELVKELQKREAIESIDAQPYEKYQITVGDKKIANTGPAIILLVID